MITTNEYRALCAVEPRLGQLDRELPRLIDEGIIAGQSFWHIWERIKLRLRPLAGYDAKTEEMASSHIYETVYRHLLDRAETLYEAYANLPDPR